MTIRFVRLLVLGGPMDGVEFPLLKTQATIGRGEDQDINLAGDGAVSRNHARLEWIDGDYWLEDIGSKYGTFLEDSEQQIAGKIKIEPGTIFRIGPRTSLKLVVEYIEDPILEFLQNLVQQIRPLVQSLPDDKADLFRERFALLLKQIGPDASKQKKLEVVKAVTTLVDTSFSQNIQMDSWLVKELERVRTFLNTALSDIVGKMEAEEAEESKQ
jgi:pSer/pThr/pTyr-binding forkhead associated (FHA) protein